MVSTQSSSIDLATVLKKPSYRGVRRFASQKPRLEEASGQS
jgi:hypothetical protein